MEVGIMQKNSLLTIAFGMVLATAPQLAAAPQRGPEEREHARSEHARREYHFREADQARLRDHYRANFHHRDHIDVSHRPRFVVGGRLPGDWRARFHPVPASVYR